GIGCVGMMFVVGRLMCGVRIGLIAALLMAVSPYHVYYSQEHRYYALLLFLSLICWWTLLRGLHSGRLGWFVAFGLTGGMLFYTHVLGIATLMGMGCGVLATWRGWPTRISWRFWFGVLITFGLAVPRLVFEAMYLAIHRPASVHQTQAALFWLDSPPWWAPVRTVGNFMVYGLRYVPVWSVGCAVVVVM